MSREENIEQMRERHEKEIRELRDNCIHTDVSQCMPFAWAPGHISHCVKTCVKCGIEIATTAIKYESEVYYRDEGDDPKDFPIKEVKPDNYFECPERKDCWRLNIK